MCLEHSKNCRTVTCGETKRKRISPKKSVRYEYQKRLRQSKQLLSITTAAKVEMLKEGKDLKSLIMYSKIRSLVDSGTSSIQIASTLQQLEAQDGVRHHVTSKTSMAELPETYVVPSMGVLGNRRRSFQTNWWKPPCDTTNDNSNQQEGGHTHNAVTNQGNNAGTGAGNGYEEEEGGGTRRHSLGGRSLNYMRGKSKKIENDFFSVTCLPSIVVLSPFVLSFMSILCCYK